MGHFKVRIEIADPAGVRFQSLEALVDTGSTYTSVPSPILESLGIFPVRRRRFQLADSTILERDVALVQVRINGEVLPTLCVFEQPGTEPLLGAVTLEEFGLGLDPVHRFTGDCCPCQDVSSTLISGGQEDRWTGETGTLGGRVWGTLTSESRWPTRRASVSSRWTLW